MILPYIIKNISYNFVLQNISSKLQTSIYISEISYFVYYLHFSHYCPHLCCHGYYNFSAIIRSGLLQVVGMSNLSLYFTYCRLF